jgi:hypothetical protein
MLSPLLCQNTGLDNQISLASELAIFYVSVESTPCRRPGYKTAA